MLNKSKGQMYPWVDIIESTITRWLIYCSIRALSRYMNKQKWAG